MKEESKYEAIDIGGKLRQGFPK